MSFKCFLSFGKINKYLWLIILALIFYACQTIIERESKFFGENMQHPVIYCINYSLSLCLSFILIIIYKVWNKNKNKKKQSTNNCI